VGNNMVGSARCVIGKDVLDNAVAVGMPGRLVSITGSTAMPARAIMAESAEVSGDVSGSRGNARFR